MVADVQEVDLRCPANRIVELDEVRRSQGHAETMLSGFSLVTQRRLKNANSPQPLVPSGMRMCRLRMPVPR